MDAASYRPLQPSVIFCRAYCKSIHRAHHPRTVNTHCNVACTRAANSSLKSFNVILEPTLASNSAIDIIAVLKLTFALIYH